MYIIVEEKSYEWVDGCELRNQPQETQDIFNSVLLFDFQNGKCIDEQFEQTGNSRRIILQKNVWEQYVLTTEYEYQYPADHEMNGIVKQLNYYINEQVD